MLNRRMVFVVGLCGILLLAFCSIVSITADDGGNIRGVTSLRGQKVSVYGGTGPYRFDSVNKAVMFRGFDQVNLTIVVPVFCFGLIAFMRKRAFGLVALASCFVYLVYNYLIGVMGNAFNELFLVWTALFATGIVGLIALVANLKPSVFDGLFNPRFPRRIMIGYMLVLALFLFGSYTFDVIMSYVNRVPPAALEHYTTLELASLELGLMVPLHVLAAVLLIRKKSLGSLLSLILSFTAFMTFAALTVFQLLSMAFYGAVDPMAPVMMAVLSLVSGTCTILGLRGFKGREMISEVA